MKRSNKKAMVGQLQVIAFSLIALAVLVGIGMIILGHLAETQENCATLASCGAAAVYNTTTDTCSNATSATCGDPSTSGWAAVDYGRDQLSSTGLLSWLPAVIALIIGIFFLTYFMGRKKSY